MIIVVGTFCATCRATGYPSSFITMFYLFRHPFRVHIKKVFMYHISRDTCVQTSWHIGFEATELLSILTNSHFDKSLCKRIIFLSQLTLVSILPVDDSIVVHELQSQHYTARVEYRSLLTKYLLVDVHHQVSP